MRFNKIKNSIRSIPKAVALRSKKAAWIMFFITIILTIWLLSAMKQESFDKAKSQFNFRTEQIVTSIKKRMEAYELVLHGGKGLFAASDEVERHDWKIYVENLDIEKNYPGILGVGFTKVVKPGEKEEFSRNIRKEGYREFRIWPKGKREIYTSIVFLEPFSGRNLRAFGYDMFSDPTRRAAMKKARDSADTFISGKVLLVQETKDDIQSGFLMYEPLYENDEPVKTIEQRRKALIGYIYSPFRMNDLMDGILRKDGANLVSFKIYDGIEIDSASLMYNSQIAPNSHYLPIYKRKETIGLQGRTWTIEFASLPAIDSLIDSEKPFIVLIAGLVISLLFLIVALALNATSRLYRRSEQILSSTNEGIFGIDLKGNCTFINKTAVSMIGYNPRTDKGKNIHQIVHESISDSVIKKEDQCPICIAIKTKKPYVSDNYIFKTGDETSFPVQYSSNPVIEHGKIRSVVVTFQNITERKRSEVLLKDSLKEKDILIKEVHHRVKNNMQIISSMLNLQSNNVTDNLAYQTLRESQNRIQSMAIIHEKLYRSGNLSGIKLKDYVNDLISHLGNSHKIDQSNIKIVQKIDDDFLGIDSAITIGLIINELMSNVFKHAFTDGSPGLVEITYSRNSGSSSILSIKDNGKGFPKNIDFQQTDSLGLQLVNTLVSQLNGEIKLKSDSGTEFVISFTKLS